MHLPPTESRPRVLHITQPVEGGVARVVADLTRAQLAAGLRVAVACPDGGLADRLRSLGADVRHWPATRSPGPALFPEVRRLARVVREVRPDLVHAHSAKAGLAGRLAVRGRVPTVFHPHAWSFEAVDGAAAALALGWERWGARWAARTVCVSEAERLRGARAGVRARWSVIPNGIDLDRFGADEVAEQARVADAGTAAPDAPLVVCVGRLCRQKGQDVLLAAWESVLARVPGARLVLVGDGPDRARLTERASACRPAPPGPGGGHPGESRPASVLFTGAVVDVVPWYRAADLVVLPSRWEGMALAPLEAMACGRPVVVTDVDGARESLPPALVPHCVVPAENPAALADAVARLLLDAPLRTSLGRRGRAHVRSTHDVRHTASAVAALYDGLLVAGGATTGPLTVHGGRPPAPAPHHPDSRPSPPAHPREGSGPAPAERPASVPRTPAEPHLPGTRPARTEPHLPGTPAELHPRGTRPAPTESRLRGSRPASPVSDLPGTRPAPAASCLPGDGAAAGGRAGAAPIEYREPTHP
ncbi:glycosyl transferase [Streptomyces ambofaciens]|uniref:Glycosyl transferase n=1 Tax=Streptomyces ambofaciens TaxID=1889 RepID=A0ABN4P593_STRAM|nr:glycosyl transferase [Streptomyces ambofaciens]